MEANKCVNCVKPDASVDSVNAWLGGDAMGWLNDCIHHHNWNHTNCRREAAYRIPNYVLNICTYGFVCVCVI